MVVMALVVPLASWDHMVCEVTQASQELVVSKEERVIGAFLDHQVTI